VNVGFGRLDQDDVATELRIFLVLAKPVLDFRVGPDLIAEGMLWVLAMGLIGGLLPAVRVARWPVVEALRAS